MALYAFVAPIQPNKTEDFRKFVSDLNGSRKEEYETSRANAGFQRESIFLQNTPGGPMVVVIQEADNQKDALASLRGMKDSFNTWYFQKLKDIHGIDIVGSDVPMNELLLDYRSEPKT
jgi:uncharacterized protein DUF6176